VQNELSVNELRIENSNQWMSNPMDIEINRQISVAIENQPGRLGQIGRLLAQQGIDINAFSVIDNVEQAMVRLVTEEPAAARTALEQAGLPVVEVDVLMITMEPGPGGLAFVGETLASAEINIEYAYSSAARDGNLGRLVVKTANPRHAQAVLQQTHGENA
jgi:hypothetical protein